MIERVPIDKNTDYKVLMQQFGIKKGVAFLSKERGYVSIRTREFNKVADKEQFDVTTAYKMAGSCFDRKFRNLFGTSEQLKDDMVQTAVLRMYELSGTIAVAANKYTKMFAIAKNAMFSVLNENQMAGPMAGRMCYFDDEVLGHGLYE